MTRSRPAVREVDPVEVEDPHQHVVDVADAGLRAPERVGLARVRRGAAAPADQPAGRLAHLAPAAATTPVRALKSAIMLVPRLELRVRRSGPERLLPARDEVLDRRCRAARPTCSSRGRRSASRSRVVVSSRSLVSAPSIHASEHLGGRLVVEAAGEVTGADPVPFALVHLRAVGRHGDDDVVGPELEVLGQLHGGEHVADARQAERRQRGERRVRARPAGRAR